MNNISLTVNGNKLSYSGGTMPASGSCRYDKCLFSFDSEWNTFSKTIVFSKGNGEEYKEILTGSYCTIPEEVLRTAGVLKIGVVGINNAGTIISTNQVSVRVRRGANETETVPVALALSMLDSGGAVG